MGTKFSRRAGAIFAAVGLLSGCVGVSPVSLPHTTFDLGAGGATSRTRPAASSGDLLYVSDAGSKVVDIYSYPKGAKVGQLAGFAAPGGLCVDGAGDIFVTNSVASGSSNIREFAHGGKTPIQTLSDPDMFPSGCAVDPVTGNLAVTNYCPDNQGACGSGRGNVLIYPKAKGSPKRYSDPLVTHFSYCGYDDAGTLYADGYGRRGRFFELVELPKGGEELVVVRIHWTRYGEKIQSPGAVQWDGKLLAIGEEQGEDIIPSIYRVAPASGRIVTILALHKSHFVQQFFIYDQVLIAPNERTKAGHLHGQILFYHYPQGGGPISTIGGLDMPVGAVVSPGTRD
jgi:hypothetical protein